MARFLHQVARSSPYPGSSVQRFAVPDEKVPWSVEWKEYAPVNYTAPVVLSKPAWADVEDLAGAKIPFNQVDDKVDRRSFEGAYAVDEASGAPLNPFGRTGLKGRGLLGRWGPNHAADPIVTRWKRNDKNEPVESNGKKVLEFVAIKRKDNGQWAIPGGMVEPGDTVSATLKKEFGEEAMNSLSLSEEERQQLEQKLDGLFGKGTEVYKGYVDDPRNTDNSWMETVAVNFHDEDGSIFSKFELHAGDDAGAVQWMALDPTVSIYANHLDFIKKVAQLRNAAL